MRFWALLSRLRPTLIQLFASIGIILLAGSVYTSGVVKWDAVRQFIAESDTARILAIWSVIFFVAAIALSHRKSPPIGDRDPIGGLRWWMVPLGIAAIAMSIWAAAHWFLGVANEAPQQDRASARIDAMRAALTVGAGAAGAIALLITIRRQWLNERAQAHDESVAEKQGDDEEERRITELFSKAVEQIGSEKAAVRLGGLYSLERLTQDYSSYQQTIVNVICAYLRMPYRVTEDLEDQQGTEELQVRMAAQSVVARNIELDPILSRYREASSWDDVKIDLSGATLHNFTIGKSKVQSISFQGARFTGKLRLGHVDGEVNLQDAVFESAVNLTGLGSVDLSGAKILSSEVARSNWPGRWAVSSLDGGYSQIYKIQGR